MLISESDLKDWVSKIIAVLTVVVCGWVGRELSQLRQAVTEQSLLIHNDQQWIEIIRHTQEDHEDRIRALEKQKGGRYDR